MKKILETKKAAEQDPTIEAAMNKKKRCYMKDKFGITTRREKRNHLKER